MGNKVRHPGMVKRSDPSFPRASFDAGPGLRLHMQLTKSTKISFLPRSSLLLIIVADRDGVEFVFGLDNA